MMNPGQDWATMLKHNEIMYHLNTMLCPIQIKSNSIELIKHTSC